MEKNKELIATIEHQNNVIKSLSKLFLTVYEIDLHNNRLYEYHSSKEISKFVDSNAPVNVTMKFVIENASEQVETNL